MNKGYLRVGQLIEELQKLDPELPVKYNDYGRGEIGFLHIISTRSIKKGKERIALLERHGRK